MGASPLITKLLSRDKSREHAKPFAVAKKAGSATEEAVSKPPSVFRSAVWKPPRLVLRRRERKLSRPGHLGIQIIRREADIFNEEEPKLLRGS